MSIHRTRYSLIASVLIILTLAAGCALPWGKPTPVPATATAPPPAATAVEPVAVEPTPAPAKPAEVPARADPTKPPADTSSESGSTPEPEPEGAHPASSLFDVQWDDRSIFRQGLISAEQQVLDLLPGATVYHIDVEVADDFFALRGHEQVLYTNREEEPLQQVYFRLFPNMAGGKVTPSAVKINGQDAQSALEYQDSALRVDLPVPLPPGEQVVIEMDFDVEVAREMAGNYGLFGYFEGVLVLDEFYPTIPVYDDEGWNVEVPPPSGDVTYYDASFYIVRVTAPTDLTIVGSGIEVDRRQEGDRLVLTLAAGPARDFYFAGSEKFTSVSQVVGETVVNSYAFKERTDGATVALQSATAALESFNERYGVYPYTEFDLLSTPMQALGVEYPGATAISIDLYNPNAEVLGLPAHVILESTVAHEVAHQWFYNVVGNDQVDEPWVDEALAQYLTGIYYLDAYGDQAASSYRQSWTDRWERVERADIPIGLPVAAYEGREYGAIVYGRGPLFVRALAMKMGQEDFAVFLRDYYQSHKWGIGTAAAFREVADRHSDRDLTELFEQWVYEQ